MLEVFVLKNQISKISFQIYFLLCSNAFKKSIRETDARSSES
jgi:hypothetical protein